MYIPSRTWMAKENVTNKPTERLNLSRFNVVVFFLFSFSVIFSFYPYVWCVVRFWKYTPFDCVAWRLSYNHTSRRDFKIGSVSFALLFRLLLLGRRTAVGNAKCIMDKRSAPFNCTHTHTHKNEPEKSVSETWSQNVKDHCNWNSRRVVWRMVIVALCQFSNENEKERKLENAVHIQIRKNK